MIINLKKKILKVKGFHSVKSCKNKTLTAALKITSIKI